VHDLVVEKAKLGKLSTCEGSPQHQDHAKMNVRILRNAMVMQRWNDQNVMNCAHVKAQHEWHKLVIIAKQCPPLPKSILVKLVSKQLLQVFGFNAQGVRSVL